MTGDLQTQVQEALDELVDSDVERGLQVAVYHNGRQVVDAVAGLADPATGRPVTSATPLYNFSVCKGAASTILHRLVDRGPFTYDTPIVDLWPAFGAHGNHNMTIRHALNHSAGFHDRSGPGLRPPTTWGLGYSIGTLGSEPRDPETAFGVGGVGGAFAYSDTANGIAFALTKNRLASDFDTATRIVGLVTDALATSVRGR